MVGRERENPCSQFEVGHSVIGETWGGKKKRRMGELRQISITSTETRMMPNRFVRPAGTCNAAGRSESGRLTSSRSCRRPPAHVHRALFASKGKGEKGVRG